MHALRTSSTLIRLVLAWFALTLGVAMASPLVAPKTMEMICSDGGTMRVIVVDKNGDVVEVGQHTLDCAMCLPASLPALAATQQMIQPQPLAHALTPIEEARIAALVGAPCRLAALPRAPDIRLLKRFGHRRTDVCLPAADRRNGSALTS